MDTAMYPFYLQSNMLYFYSQEQFLLALNNSCNANTLWLNFGEIPQHLEHLQDVLGHPDNSQQFNPLTNKS